MNKTTNIFLIIVLVIAVGFIGYFVGLDKGKKQTEENLMPIVNATYPEPPEVINRIGANVISIKDGIINVETTDPEDYLPHSDGTPKKMITRYVKVEEDTRINKVDYINYNRETGEPSVTSISLSDIKEGDYMEITSDENIREEEEVTATKIQVIIL